MVRWRALLRPGAWALVILVVLLLGVAPAAAQEPPDPNDPTVTTGPVLPSAASIVVDVETGAVITARDERTPMLPASTSKILTALLVRARLDLDADIAVSKTAAIAGPRRLGLEPGSQWGVDDLLYAAMLCSCNDAAYALGQAAGGGTMGGYQAQAAVLTDALGMSDDPVFRDPAGQDDLNSVGGGNLLSARDLAIASRAYLADPELTTIAAAPRHEWVGGDGLPHSVRNLNAFIGSYEGAIGLKTGYTERAGQTFVGAAERDGRTLLAVVYRSNAKYAEAAALLDAGFLLASAGEETDDVLPPIPDDLVLAGPEITVPPTTAPPTSASSPEPAGAAAATTEVGGGEDQVAVGAPTVTGPADDGDWPVDPVVLGGGTLVVAGGGLAALAVRRSGPGSDGIDRRPARPRRRHRRRQRIGL